MLGRNLLLVALWTSVGGLCATPLALAAPPAIPISDSLVANADQLTVTMGNQWFGEMPKWRIGDYAVVSSKLHVTHINTKGNFLGTKSDSTRSTKFSFVMSDSASHTATVDAKHAFINQSEHEFKLTKSVGVGNDALIRESDSLSAFIAVKVDTVENWTFRKTSTIDASGVGGFHAYLSKGERRIEMAPVIAAKRAGKHKRSFFSQMLSNAIPPAIGYEFVEGGQSLCAIQTFGGSLKSKEQTVWMHRSLDAGTKLALAAAITATLEMESWENDRTEP